MKTKLNLAERILLIELIPQQGNFVELTLARDLLKSVEITAQEITECKIRQQDKQIIWEKDIEKEIVITNEQLELIKNKLKELNDNKQLRIEMIDLINKLNIEL